MGEWVAAESYFILKHSPIAQLVEQMAVNHRAAGSSPARGAIYFIPFHYIFVCVKYTYYRITHYPQNFLKPFLKELIMKILYDIIFNTIKKIFKHK